MLINKMPLICKLLFVTPSHIYPYYAMISKSLTEYSGFCDLYADFLVISSLNKGGGRFGSCVQIPTLMDEMER